MAGTINQAASNSLSAASPKGAANDGTGTSGQQDSDIAVLTSNEAYYHSIHGLSHSRMHWSQDSPKLRSGLTQSRRTRADSTSSQRYC